MRAIRRFVLHALKIPIVVSLTVGGLACVFQQAVVTELDQRKPPVQVSSPVKAHLLDGSTVIYGNGVRLEGNHLVTVGQRFALGSVVPVRSSPVPLDSVVGMESFDTKTRVAQTVFATAGAVAVGTVATAALLVALFGSCPTFYADSAGTQVLQAEGFSYSIAPLLEQRDVDRLRLTPTADGRAVLYVRNEALETHYINHLELIEVSHEPGEQALPDQHGLPLVVKNATVPPSVRDRSGRNIEQAVRSSDGNIFSTADQTLRNVSTSDLEDYIDITVPRRGNSDSVAVVLDMRNSLLNTVLLYDGVLGNPGLRSLDYLGKDLGRIGNALDIARWFTARMGMRISVRDGETYRQVARFGDSGPIAFHNLAVLVPVLRGTDDSVRIRLSFTADDWRIDAIHVSADWRRPSSRPVQIAGVTMQDKTQNASALASLREVDEGYLVTSPGQRFSVEFDVGAAASGTRTYLLASQGYYTEWVRGSWIKSASGKPFTPDDAALVEAIRAWRAKQPAMERQFYSTQISAR